MKESPEFNWPGRLKEVLKAAIDGMRQANKRYRKTGKGSRWESVEVIHFGFGKARHWILDLDPTQAMVKIRPNPGRQPPRKNTPKTDATQPGLFEVGEGVPGTHGKHDSMSF